jgi:hypothetical protein
LPSLALQAFLQENSGLQLLTMSIFCLLSLLLLSSIGFSETQFYYTDSSCRGQPYAHRNYDNSTSYDLSRAGFAWRSPNNWTDTFLYWKVADGLGLMKNLTENATEVSSACCWCTLHVVHMHRTVCGNASGTVSACNTLGKQFYELLGSGCWEVV